MDQLAISVWLGSLRNGSHNTQLATAFPHLVPRVTWVYEAHLDDLPFYNQDIDIEGKRPAAVDAFYASVARADAVIIVTPEYNGGASAVIKNAIDWASRPSRRGVLAGKPAAVVSATLGQFGGVWAQDDARKALGIAGARVVTEPVIAIGNVRDSFSNTPPESDLTLGSRLDAIVAELRRQRDIPTKENR